MKPTHNYIILRRYLRVSDFQEINAQNVNIFIGEELPNVIHAAIQRNLYIYKYNYILKIDVWVNIHLLVGVLVWVDRVKN